MTKQPAAPTQLARNEWWWHEAHSLHDEAHHQHHRPLDLCVPLYGRDQVEDLIERFRTAMRVAAHRPHDQDGLLDEPSGWPTCSGCGAIQDPATAEAARAALPAAAQPAPLDRYGGLIAAMDNAVAQGLTVHMATRATCAEHLAHGDDKATQPLTAAAFGLDVNRLREAAMRVESGYIVKPDRTSRAYWQKIAAAYARLSQPPAEPKP